MFESETNKAFILVLKFKHFFLECGRMFCLLYLYRNPWQSASTDSLLSLYMCDPGASSRMYQYEQVRMSNRNGAELNQTTI